MKHRVARPHHVPAKEFDELQRSVAHEHLRWLRHPAIRQSIRAVARIPRRGRTAGLRGHDPSGPRSPHRASLPEEKTHWRGHPRVKLINSNVDILTPIEIVTKRRAQPGRLPSRGCGAISSQDHMRGSGRASFRLHSSAQVRTILLPVLSASSVRASASPAESPTTA